MFNKISSINHLAEYTQIKLNDFHWHSIFIFQKLITFQGNMYIYRIHYQWNNEQPLLIHHLVPRVTFWRFRNWCHALLIDGMVHQKTNNFQHYPRKICCIRWLWQRYITTFRKHCFWSVIVYQLILKME